MTNHIFDLFLHAKFTSIYGLSCVSTCTKKKILQTLGLYESIALTLPVPEDGPQNSQETQIGAFQVLHRLRNPELLDPGQQKHLARTC